MIKGFWLLFGGCKIGVPSAKGALILVAWFFGTVPGMSWGEYRDALIGQYIDAGQHLSEARASVAHIEACFARWRPEK